MFKPASEIKATSELPFIMERKLKAVLMDFKVSCGRSQLPSNR